MRVSEVGGRRAHVGVEVHQARLRLEPDGDGPMGPSRMAFTKPTIAAVEGYAVAGGLELSLMCDLRVASETAVFGVFCRRWGVPLLDGGTVRLPRLIGLSRALDLILTGRPVDAREALALGLANRVVPPGHARNWRKHCHKYDACGRPAYFVQDSWYRSVYVPHYRERHRDDRRDDRRGDDRDWRDDRGNGHEGKSRGKGHPGKGHD